MVEDLVLGADKHRRRSTSANIPSSAPPACPFAKILGRGPTIDEIFLYTHTKKESSEISGENFVDKRSEEAYVTRPKAQSSMLVQFDAQCSQTSKSHEKFKKRKVELKLPNTSAEGDAAGCTPEEVEAEEQSTQSIKEKSKIYGYISLKNLPVVETPELKAAVA
ncbi:hypothetical protein Cgig2_003011 [Carnegiea gigantea]|uniref:Uncharacterized protein n=1 Tax=Carnegiea gigantea TaxID=171969 RepID=A0A9Q1GSQ8_9CARY|nr:hypothetical protein Cgig2_003011 [Carnegiea gigantea]